MPGFKEMVETDIHKVFLNVDELAETRTVVYDGERYEDIPVMLFDLKEKDRQSSSSDNAQGLYKVTATLQCALEDIGGKQPEKDMTIKINHEEGGGGYFSEYYIVTSGCEMGMVKLELGAVDE